MATPLLEVKALDVSYGDAQALWDVSLQVQAGTIVSLVGANGAGKTTLLKTISGLVRPKRGEIHFNGRALVGTVPQDIVSLGISHVPEGRGLFAQMTVLENLELGAYPKKVRNGKGATLEHAYALFPKLKERAHQKAGSLSGGEQQMLAIARAIMAKPKLLILDEPSLGLSPLIVKAMFELIQKLNADGVTILLVEQNIHQALKIANFAFVLQTGRVVMQGTGDQLLADRTIQSAYIGKLG